MTVQLISIYQRLHFNTFEHRKQSHKLDEMSTSIHYVVCSASGAETSTCNGSSKGRGWCIAI